MNSAKKTAFTLIELLVVIAIIALLTAILFPVFARARENARRAACQSNVKQIALGLIQYTQDYDERLPNFKGETVPPYYHEMLQSYMKGYQVFRCPSVRKNTDAPATSTFPTYGLVGKDDASAPGLGNEHHIYDADGAHMTWVPQPAITYMVAETCSNINSVATTGDGYYLAVFNALSYGSPLTSANVSKTANPAHLEGYNMGFVDGHVKWVKRGNESNYAVSLHTYCLASPEC